VSIPTLVRRCIDGVERRYGLSATSVRANMPADCSITTDPTALETVLKNLLDNAVKYSPSPPEIEVNVRPSQDGSVEIAVSDRGIGLEKANLKRIFRRFYRVASDDVYARSGTGLGLYVVAALVRNLGGSIEAQSEGLERGTSMKIRLPSGVSTEAAL